jgi:hypothetical protein
MKREWTRRQALKAMAIFGTITASLSQMAVSCSNLFTEILAYISVGLQGFASIVSILSGVGVVPLGSGAALNAIIALVKAGFADLQTAVNDYEAAPAANKTTLEGKISTVLHDLQNEITAFWNNLTIPDAQTAALIQGLLEVITTTLAGFATQLPPAPASSAALHGSFSKKLAFTAQRRSKKQFKNDFNAILHAHGQDRYAI